MLALRFASAEATPLTVGLTATDNDPSRGYTLFGPLQTSGTYLLDNEGQVAHSWGGPNPSISNYLLEDGSLFRNLVYGPNPFMTGGAAGRIEHLDWDGNSIWLFDYVPAHHDISVLPNGNVLMIAWEAKMEAEAIAAGRDPALLGDDELWPDYIIEVEPTGPTTGDIVWEWHPWDHLIQDFDNTKSNFGVVGDYPELVDVNFFEQTRPADGEADWMHSNSIDYNPALDQIILSVRHFSEFWVIDHSTTTAEAASHSGGNSGKGGDLLYRWGNPQAYDAGTSSDQQLFVQHDAEWIEPGLPGAGNIIVFNNGTARPGGNYSSVDELVPPVDQFGNYAYTTGQPYGPASPTWSYVAPNPPDFYSAFISGANRTSNGNTLITHGAKGKLFEVTPAGATVWSYVNPKSTTGTIAQGNTPPNNTNLVFRSYRYEADYAGLDGRDLTPSGVLEIEDSDGDGLENIDELKVYLTNPAVADTDGDGCEDGVEVQTGSGSQLSGGLRDPLDPNDYFNPTQDGLNRIDDILAVVLAYFVDDTDGNPGLPPYSPGYNPDLDRSNMAASPNPWNTGAPDGLQRVQDILHAVNSYFHDCA